MRIFSSIKGLLLSGFLGIAVVMLALAVGGSSIALRFSEEIEYFVYRSWPTADAIMEAKQSFHEWRWHLSRYLDNPNSDDLRNLAIARERMAKNLDDIRQTGIVELSQIQSLEQLLEQLRQQQALISEKATIQQTLQQTLNQHWIKYDQLLNVYAQEDVHKGSQNHAYVHLSLIANRLISDYYYQLPDNDEQIGALINQLHGERSNQISAMLDELITIQQATANVVENQQLIARHQLEINSLLNRLDWRLDRLEHFTHIEMTSQANSNLANNATIRIVLLVLAIAAISVAIIISLWITKAISVPLQKLSQITKQFASGKLEMNIEDTGLEETNELAKAYGEMLEQLKQSTVSRDHFDNILHSTPNAILVLNLAGQIQTVNRAATSLLGQPKHKLLGRPLNDFLSGLRLPRIHDTSLKQGLLINTELELKRNNQPNVAVAFSAALMLEQNNDNKAIICTAQDISERKKAEQEILQAKQSAERADRAKSEFLANMSHEIRTPINGVVGMTSLLMDSGLSSEQKELGLTIQSCAESLLDIINDILDFSKIEAGKLDLQKYSFIPADFIEEAANMLALQAHNKNLELIVQIDPQLYKPFLGDESRLRQVLVNLLSNAIKFTDRGEVMVKASCTAKSAERTTLHISVKDSGIGIEPFKQSQLFQPFAQADTSITRQFGGTGLGLIIAKQLIGMMQGDIGFESTPGRGSEFWFSVRLPADNSTDLNAPSVEYTGPAEQSFLVCSKHAGIREVLYQYMGIWNIKPAICEAVEAFAASIDNSQGEAPVVIVDASAAHEQQQLEQLLQQGRFVADRIVLLLTINSLDMREKWQQLGIKHFLTKPVKRRALLSSLNRICNKLDQQACEHLPQTKDDTHISRHLHILIVEDNLVNQQVSSKMLNRLGYNTHICANGNEALTTLKTMHFDMVLMDLQMPIMDGYSATKAIRAQNTPWSDIPIVACTANALSDEKERCLAAGMNDYISKPFKIDQLNLVIEKWTRASQHHYIS